MKRSILVILSSGFLITSSLAFANNAPETVGVQAFSGNELTQVVTGWSAKRQIIGKTVFNEKNEKIGVIDDIVIAPDKAVSYAIVGAGGFLGVAKHDVAISTTHFQQLGDKFVVSGASKEMLKKIPEFKYAATR